MSLREPCSMAARSLHSGIRTSPVLTILIGLRCTASAAFPGAIRNSFDVGSIRWFMQLCWFSVKWRAAVRR